MGFKNEHVHAKKDVARINERKARGRRPWSALYSTAPLAAWLGELDAPGASYHGRAAGKVSNIGGVVRPVLRHHHHRQDYHYHSERDELGRHCVLQEVR